MKAHHFGGLVVLMLAASCVAMLLLGRELPAGLLVVIGMGVVGLCR